MKKIGVVFAALFFTHAANAGLMIDDYFNVSFVEMEAIPPDNDFFPGGEILLGAQVNLLKDARLFFQGVFSEAAQRSTFNSQGNSLSNRNIGDSFRDDYFASLLPFDFVVNDLGTSVTNANNPAQYVAGGLPNFGVLIDGTKMFIGLDDDDGSDIDLDDSVVMVQVPEPGSEMILAMGLIGLGLTRQRGVQMIPDLLLCR